MDVAILLYDGFDELDAVGPYEVFQAAGEAGGPVSASLVTLDPTNHITASHGMSVRPSGRLADQDCDLLVVPGGGWTDRSAAGARAEARDGAIPSAVAAAHDEGVRVASVCTGAMLLAEAGVLEGRPATTHHGALDDLRATGAAVRDERFVDDGDVLTAAGVTAGIDLALHVVADACGEAVADTVATEIEYERAI